MYTGTIDIVERKETSRQYHEKLPDSYDKKKNTISKDFWCGPVDEFDTGHWERITYRNKNG